MNWRRIAGAVVLAAPLIASSRVDAQSVADSVRRLDSLWANAYATHDTVFALRAMAEDFTMTAGAGTKKDRRAELGDVRESPGYVVQYFRSRDVDVRVHGSAAVVTGRLEWIVAAAGRTAPETRRRYTATWVRGGPLGWRLVALHVGPAPAG
jgi:ketosteroid isomerase-like protein